MTTPLGLVRGLGSAKGGTRTYVLKQASGVAQGILTLTGGVGIYLFDRERQFVVDSISTFWVGPPLAAFIILTALHMDIGMRSIIEHYVHSGHRKLALIFASSLFSRGYLHHVEMASLVLVDWERYASCPRIWSVTMPEEKKEDRFDKPLLGAQGSARVAESVDTSRTPLEDIEAAKVARVGRKPPYGTTK